MAVRRVTSALVITERSYIPTRAHTHILFLDVNKEPRQQLETRFPVTAAWLLLSLAHVADVAWSPSPLLGFVI